MFDIAKKEQSILIPYRLKAGGLEVYLQKRSPQQKLAGYFGFWGGHLERGETPLIGLQREIKEEMSLEIDVTIITLFNRYEFLKNIKNIYIFIAPENWESNIVVGEGNYGKWLKIEEALILPNIIFEDKVVLNDLERKILGNPVQ